LFEKNFLQIRKGFLDHLFEKEHQRPKISQFISTLISRSFPQPFP
jgi:hypothetical protein